MYRIVIFILLLSFTMPAFPATRKIVTQTPYYNQYYAPQAYWGGDYIPSRKYSRRVSSRFNDINDLERYAFNKNFTRESDRSRLERLENLAFGAIQEGDIYTRYNNARNAILTKPKQSFKTSVMQNISDYFNGQLTGFSPSISTPSSDYGKHSYSGYSTPWGKAYRTNNYGIGSGSSVHILD